MTITSANVARARDFFGVLQHELRNFDGTGVERRGLQIRYAIARARYSIYCDAENGTLVQDDRYYAGILEILNEVTEDRFEEFVKGRVAS